MIEGTMPPSTSRASSPLWSKWTTKRDEIRDYLRGFWIECRHALRRKLRASRLALRFKLASDFELGQMIHSLRDAHLELEARRAQLACTVAPEALWAVDQALSSSLRLQETLLIIQEYRRYKRTRVLGWNA